jgi:hypothetical protein
MEECNALSQPEAVPND